MTARWPGAVVTKNSPNHAVLDSLYEVFALISCVWYLSSVELCIKGKHLYFYLACLVVCLDGTL